MIIIRLEKTQPQAPAAWEAEFDAAVAKARAEVAAQNARVAFPQSRGGRS